MTDLRSMFMQGLIFVFICILIFKFYIVHNIASHDAISAARLAPQGGESMMSPHVSLDASRRFYMTRQIQV